MGKVLAISAYFEPVAVFSSPSVFCAKQVSNSTTRCREQCVNTRLNVALEYCSDGLRDTHFHTVTVRLPAPEISSAGVEAVPDAGAAGAGW